MPKDAKQPLFCCGTQHKSANYHRRTVHQQHTKIYFRGHPEASFILRRNPVTSLFHCPHCDKSWAMATPIRNHIFQRCSGYAQYRSQAAAKSSDQASILVTSSAEGSSQIDSPLQDSPDVANVQAKEEHGHATNGHHPNVITGATSLLSSGNATPPQESGQPASVGATVPTSSPGNSSGPNTLEQVISFPPVLRPAIWSPVNGRFAETAEELPHVHFTMETGVRPVSSLPGLWRTASACSSRSSLRTLADDASAPRSTMTTFKCEPDYAGLPPASVLRTGSSLSGPSLSSPLSPRHSPERPTAVRRFLDTLRRPLGHAAPLLYKMGLVSEADLDLICTMPESWDEVGAVLQTGGITTIEWLMVKEAFKMRAKDF
ncbi:hypothetical protein BV20DRAFT_430433 [Pilatotrama ljubarskyi]|nr:hypothetical protein BV20DRAFT_430433 [Pilatotrama ljubarskyi]